MGVPQINAFLNNTLYPLHRSVELGGFPEEVREVLAGPERVRPVYHLVPTIKSATPART
ncbi:MAG: hypothetical protein JZD41_05845 [Thermoproteus sp.]|nr:hypothetical protein [Thermoproteus sp.]